MQPSATGESKGYSSEAHLLDTGIMGDFIVSNRDRLICQKSLLWRGDTMHILFRRNARVFSPGCHTKFGLSVTSPTKRSDEISTIPDSFAPKRSNSVSSGRSTATTWPK